MSERPLALIVGAGEGLGEALMRRFDRAGYRSIGFARTLEGRDASLALRKVDATDAEAMASGLDAVMKDYGAPKVVVHNPARLVIKDFEDTAPAEFEACWRSMCLSAMLLAQNIMGPMVENGGGAFLVSGATASIRGGAKFAAFASAKFALRGLCQSLARAYQPKAIHVAHFILDGIIDTKNSRALHGLNQDHMMQVADIAEIYWQVAQQPPSAWVHEMDLRPSSEGF